MRTCRLQLSCACAAVGHMSKYQNYCYCTESHTNCVPSNLSSWGTLHRQKGLNYYLDICTYWITFPLSLRCSSACVESKSHHHGDEELIWSLCLLLIGSSCESCQGVCMCVCVCARVCVREKGGQTQGHDKEVEKNWKWQNDCPVW